MTNGTVYVGIVTYNSVHDLPGCFASLRAQTYPTVRITVLDNQSTDESVPWVRSHAPDAAILESGENLGFGRGHNAILRALKLHDGDFYLPLNPDAQLEPDYIARLVEASAAHGAGWLIGKLLLANDDGSLTGLIYSAGQGIRRDGHVINVGQQLADDGSFDESREIMLASGAAMLLRAELIRDLAPSGDLFEPVFFMYGEDIDLGWRARLAGWRCWYEASVSASHRGGSQSPQMRAQAQANLYLSALRNAYAVDLLTTIIPLMLLSLAARCVLSPRQGFATLRLTARHAVTMLRRRTPAKISRADMLVWHRWSAAQPTAQALALSQRIRNFLAQRKASRRL